MTISVSGSQITFNDSSTQNTAATGFGFKNRIINGDMRIDQRNAGASVTLTNTVLYTVDRWSGFENTDGGATAQQVTDAPTGFNNSLKITITSQDSSLGAAQRLIVQHRIEGYNIADLGFGSANAKTITLSFWVKSSLTGTFGGGFTNASDNRGYAFTYTISAANTWEYKSVTIAGDTTGTWGTTNGNGITITFGLGVGSTYSATSGSWVAQDVNSATGAVSVIGTNGATWYLTGVQLEKGSTATSFDYRPYGQELQLCQRYFEKSYEQSVAVGTITGSGVLTLSGSSDNNTNFNVPLVYKVEKRATPTVTAYTNTGVSGNWVYARSGVGATNTVTNFYGPSTASGTLFGGVGASWVVCQVGGHYTVSAEL